TIYKSAVSGIKGETEVATQRQRNPLPAGVEERVFLVIVGIGHLAENGAVGQDGRSRAERPVERSKVGEIDLIGLRKTRRQDQGGDYSGEGEPPSLRIHFR